MNDSDDKLSEILSGYNPSFKDGFSDRVINNIELEAESSIKEDIEFYTIFKMIALSGIAAIIVLLFTIYINEGSFSVDALYGLLDYTVDEPLFTSLNY